MTDHQAPKPILLADLDAVIDMGPWQHLATARRWFDYFSHIPEARPRGNELLDALELATAEGCAVAYTSRWPGVTTYLVREWLSANGFPEHPILDRRGFEAPADLLARHARVSAGRFRFRRPVLVIHNDADVAAEARRVHGLAAIGVAQLPPTVDGLRRLFTLARPAAPKTKKESA
jgi:hypothetical protein